MGKKKKGGRKKMGYCRGIGFVFRNVELGGRGWGGRGGVRFVRC